MNKFFQKISEIKYNICPNAQLDEIAKSLIIYFENKEILNHFLNVEENKSSDEDLTNFYFDLKILWKDLSKIFSNDDLQETSELDIFLYLNLEIGELIISKKHLEYFKNLDQNSWEVIIKKIKIKKPLTVSIELNQEYKNNIKTITTYEKETNLLHVNFEKEKEL